MNVSGASTLKWLNMSRVNLAPSTNQPNGVLEDPLTPYDLNSVLDPGTGLVTSKPSFLDVNQKLIDSGDLHFMTGSKIGQAVKNEADLEQDYFPFGDTTLPVGTHAPGLVYRWKQGVVTVTRNVNLRNALDGTGIASHRLAQEVGISITPQPFSNLDAADVVSLVVTGFPHNYESFLINSQSVGGYNYGSQSNNPESYFHYFFDVTRNTNRALGNFQPYKTYNVSQSQLAQRLSLQTDLQSQSKKLAQLRSQLAQLQDRLNAMNTSPTNISKTDDNLRKISVGGISSDIGAVKAQIALATAAFTNLTKKSGSAGLRVYGNDIALGLETDTTSSDQDAIQQNDKRIRMKNELLQLRSQLKTKFNNDTNLFIVSDDYDKDLDIQAFITDSIASHEIPLWNNTQFQNPFQICVNVAKTLDFEFFCMAEDTIILTMNNNGEIESKFIKDFENNDMVLSISTIDRSVSWKRAKLSKRKLNETEKMFEIRNGRGEIIKLSDNHKILDENLNEVFVKNLKNGDRLATANSLPNIEEDFCLDISSMFTDHKWYKDLGDSFKICGQGSKCKLIPKNIELDVDLSWILGLYVAEGSISDPENRIDKKTRGYHTVFSLNYDEINIAERVKSIIKKKFNIDANIYRYEKYSRCTVDVGSFVFSKIMKSIFGRTTCYNKKVPKIIWRSKNENKLSFLAGVFMGDGTYDRKLSLTSASEQLHNDVSQLFLMLGIENKKSKYRHTLIYGKNNLKIMLPYLSGWKHEEKILKYCNNGNADIKNRKNINNSEIKNITEIKYNSFVYDLEVDDNHTFLINNTWSHNCDTQGHIQFRCPKYNKTPLSLLLKMFLLSKNQNQKLYPPFLDQLFKDRLQAYKDQLNILELNININNILLGRAFIFSSPAANSTIQDEGASVTSSTVIGGLLGADTEQPSGAQLSDRANMLITTRNDLANTIGGTPNIKDPNDAAEVQAAEQEISNLNNPATPNVNSQRLVLINKVADLEAEKQSVTTIVDRLTSQASKYDQSIDGAPQSNQPLSPAQMTEILTPFADLIEDDFNDFLGPGSSKRFTIYDDQIINSTFTESDQNVFCRVDVNGQQDLLGEEPGVLGGIPMIWAGATDFDLWRQYGWRADGAVNKPFFKNAETQCAPYALMLLSRAKRDAVQGSITVYGNEYYQLGDVVYVNCRDLLYYVTSVKHNFDYNAGSFTTTLDLRYGHPLGEYIATPLDVIGKNLIQNQKNFNTKTILRQTATPARGTSLGVILFSSSPQPNEQTGNTTTSPTAEDAFKEMLLGDTGKTNLTTLKNIFTIAKDKIVSGQAFPKLDIRGFVSSDSDDKQRVLNRIAAVQKWFNTPSSAPDQLLSKDYQGFDPSAILTTSDSADPINVKTLQPANVFFGRVPREDVFNVLTTREFTDVIEIVLVNQ
jgi:intein/homing endonuclease